jgi:hypothetical protein
VRQRAAIRVTGCCQIGVEALGGPLLFNPRAGESLRPFFTGDAPDLAAYCETYYREEQSQVPGGIPGLGPLHCIRLENRHKVILDVQSNALSAYDLTADPAERNALVFPHDVSR